MSPDSDGTENAITLAHSYMEARDHRRAKEVLRSALVHHPHDARLLTALAQAEHLLRDNKAAERTVVQALAAAPEDAYAMRVYAAILCELGRRDEGLSWARRAVEAAPLQYTMHYEYARLLAVAGDAKAALPVATEALRLAPDDADTHDLMGVVLGLLGRRAESTAEHEEALRLNPGHARALANIAVNRANSKNVLGAIAGFTEAAQLDPHLGDEVRRHITATVRRWLSWTTIAAWAALWILLRVVDEDVARSPAARAIAGVGCIVVLVMFGWLARSVPRHLWAPILRQRGFRSLQIYLALGVLVVAVLGAFALRLPIGFWPLLGTLMLTVAVSWLAPRFDDE